MLPRKRVMKNKRLSQPTPQEQQKQDCSNTLLFCVEYVRITHKVSQHTAHERKIIQDRVEFLITQEKVKETEYDYSFCHPAEPDGEFHIPKDLTKSVTFVKFKTEENGNTNPVGTEKGGKE